jgi:hypothetical protein
MIAKDLMPWLFVNRKAQWTPFAKVRCEGGRCVWGGRPKTKGRTLSGPASFAEAGKSTR